METENGKDFGDIRSNLRLHSFTKLQSISLSLSHCWFTRTGLTRFGGVLSRAPYVNVPRILAQILPSALWSLLLKLHATFTLNQRLAELMYNALSRDLTKCKVYRSSKNLNVFAIEMLGILLYNLLNS